MNSKLECLADNLKNFKVELNEDQLAQVEAYTDFLVEYNKHTNLVSANDVNLIYDKHLYDSFSFCKYFTNDNSYAILDIGSGGGFPVIPIAIVMQKSSVIALDATRKKTDFLLKVSKALNLSNFSVINDRAENIAFNNKYREKFDIVTTRAVGNLAMISELCLPFVKLGGSFYSYKAAKTEEELKLAETTIRILGGELEDIFQYDLKLSSDFTRNLLKIKKIKASPNDYPRSFAAIKNHPLRAEDENL